MLHAGLDLSRRRLDVCLIDDGGEVVDHTAAPPDADGLRHLAERLRGQPVRAVIESMTGARFVHDTLEELGWEVLVADAQKVKGLAPLACKTDKIDARVLAELSWRDLLHERGIQDGPDRLVRRQACRVEPNADIAELLSLLCVEVRPALTRPLVAPVLVARERDLQRRSENHKAERTRTEMALVDAQPVLADDDVVDNDGEAVVEEVGGEHRGVGRAQCKLTEGLLSRLLIRPERTPNDERLQGVGFDVHTPVEAFREQP
jgi:hypothetical protein